MAAASSITRTVSLSIRTRGGLAALVVPVALVACLAGCGSSSSSSATSSSSSGSATSSSATGSGTSSAQTTAGACAALQTSSTAPITGPGGPSLATLLKAHPPAIRSLTFTQRNCSELTGSEVISDQTTSVQLKPKLLIDEAITVAGRVIRVRFIGNEGYVYLPQIASQDGGRPWMSMTLAQAGAAAGINLQQLLSQVENLDPAHNLKLLEQAGDFRALGAATVNGERVYGFQGSFQVAHLPSTFSKQVTQQLLALIHRVGATAENTTSYVTPAGRAVRILVILTTKAHGQIVNVENISAVNVPVQVSPPPASQTVSYDKLKALEGGGATSSTSTP